MMAVDMVLDREGRECWVVRPATKEEIYDFWFGSYDAMMVS